MPGAAPAADDYRLPGRWESWLEPLRALHTLGFISFFLGLRRLGPTGMTLLFSGYEVKDLPYLMLQIASLFTNRVRRYTKRSHEQSSRGRSGSPPQRDMNSPFAGMKLSPPFPTLKSKASSRSVCISTASKHAISHPHNHKTPPLRQQARRAQATQLSLDTCHTRSH